MERRWGTDPFHDLTPEGAAGDPDHVPEAGTAYVDSRITGPGAEAREGRSGPDAHDFDDYLERARERMAELRERASDWGGRAGDVAARAGREFGGALDRAEDRLESRTGAISIIREHPLVAAGLAFGVGFLLAGDASRRRGITGFAAGRLRNALVGGLTTLAMQELQELLDEHGGPAGLVRLITRGEADD